MTNFEKHIEKAGKEFSLSADEKARMHRVLSSYMRHKPIRTANSQSISIYYSWFSILQRPIAAALVLVLVFGSGMTYAAESSLPGDVLYAVKTGINEPVRVALAANAETKAEVQMEIAERRIEEATVLSAEGRLDDSLHDELAASFKSYASAVAESIEATAAEDTSASLELAARFENRLVAHENVLAEVEMEFEAEDERERSHRLTDAIRATNEILAEARFGSSNVAVSSDSAVGAELVATSVAEDASAGTATEPVAMTMMAAEPAPDDMARHAKTASVTAQGNAETPAPSERSISRMKSAAEKGLKNAQKTLRNAKSLSADAKARAEADITLAEDLIDDGKEFQNNENGIEAYAAFNESLRISEQTTVYIKAAPSLEKARARNSRSRGNNSSSQKEATVEVNVSLSGSTATVTATTSDPSDGPTHDANDDNGIDDPDHDANDDHGGEDESNDDRGSDTSGTGFKLLQKLNISL